MISLALLAPLVPLLLYQWYVSLDRWYVPWGQGKADYFDVRFDQAVQQLQQASALHDGVIHVITDSDCVCSAPVIRRLISALETAAQPAVVVHDLRTLDPNRDALWLALAQRFPSVPSALVMRDGKPAYIGPVVAGNLCTRAAQSILPLQASQQPQPVVNWLSEGCYCPVQAQD